MRRILFSLLILLLAAGCSSRQPSAPPTPTPNLILPTLTPFENFHGAPFLDSGPVYMRDYRENELDTRNLWLFQSADGVHEQALSFPISWSLDFQSPDTAHILVIDYIRRDRPRVGSLKVLSLRDGTVIPVAGGGTPHPEIDPDLTAWYFTPAWSPNSRLFAFAGARDGETEGIYLFDLRDRSLRKLVSSHAEIVSLHWSPDGRQIAYVTAQESPDEFNPYGIIHVARLDDAGDSEPPPLVKKVNGPGVRGWLDNDHLWYLLSKPGVDPTLYDTHILSVHDGKDIYGCGLMWPDALAAAEGAGVLLHSRCAEYDENFELLGGISGLVQVDVEGNRKVIAEPDLKRCCYNRLFSLAGPPPRWIGYTRDAYTWETGTWVALAPDGSEQVIDWPGWGNFLPFPDRQHFLLYGEKGMAVFSVHDLRAHWITQRSTGVVSLSPDGKFVLFNENQGSFVAASPDWTPRPVTGLNSKDRDAFRYGIWITPDPLRSTLNGLAAASTLLLGLFFGLTLAGRRLRSSMR